jgi:hypothetical protein
MIGRCTCRQGRDDDGSEFGPCEWCEGQAYDEENGLTDEALQAAISGEAVLTTEEALLLDAQDDVMPVWSNDRNPA